MLIVSGHPYLGSTRTGRGASPINFKDFLNWNTVLLNNKIITKMYDYIMTFLLL